MIEAKPALRCLRCLYGDQHGYCSYILVTQQRSFDTEWARVLYDAGRTDVSIAEACGVCVGTISNWRSREGLPSKHRGGVRK